jgi:hypothetical protein
METKEQSTTASRKPRPSTSVPAVGQAARSGPETGVKLLLVTFRSGEAVERHPDVEPWLESGWTVRSAVPRVVESGATKLLVVLEREPVAVDLSEAGDSGSGDVPRLSA